MLHRDDAAPRGDAVEANDTVIEADDEPKQSEHPARPEPAKSHCRRARRQQERQPDCAEDKGPGEEGKIECERPRPAHCRALARFGSGPTACTRSKAGQNKAAMYSRIRR